MASSMAALRYAEVPQGLVESIQSGQCVAFVGAGFSAEVVPGWAALLRGVTGRLKAEPGTAPDLLVRVEQLLSKADPTARELEAAAQLLMDAAGNRFAEQIHAEISSVRATPRMKRRVELLRGIPFRAILTTNFDNLLEGELPSHQAYDRVLRPHEHRWWHSRFWDEGHPGAAVVKLHGDLGREPGSVVLATRDYRRRLYSEPAYMGFLRSLFATTTVLYLGFSFTDAYLNELISEVLALLGHVPDRGPIAYAIANDVSDAMGDYLTQHEGIHAITYDSRGKTDFSGFDSHLGFIHEQTNPTRHLGRLLAGKRILWVDAAPDNNTAGMRFLLDAAQGAAQAPSAAPCSIEQIRSCAEAVAVMAELKPASPDLVITQWGHQGACDDSGSELPVAERLLLDMRHQDLFAPVIVFASGAHADQNRQRALALGAQGYVSNWADLFRQIERVLSGG